MKNTLALPRLHFFRQPRFLLIAKVSIAVILLASAATLGYAYYQAQQQLQQEQAKQAELLVQLNEVDKKLAKTEEALINIQAVDQFQRNEQLNDEIDNLQKGFAQATTAYEDLLKLNELSDKKSTLSGQFTQIVTLLGKREYQPAIEQIAQLRQAIKAENDRLAALAVTVAPNIPTNNSPPSSGYQRQAVESDVGTFQVDIVAADLNSTRVVVETASDSTCADNCPVDSLATFISRAGGYAGINGPYFCPAEYPSCAGKTNSFDTLIMNRHKTYFNSDNNVHSVVPLYVFSGSSATLYGQSSSWGRDTGVDAVIAAQPLLLQNNEVRFGGDGDPKKGSRGSRSFIGNKGSTVYIGVVRSATVAEVGHVLKKMGLDNALNLDSGGSTALYAGGRYVAGPGRNTPFGIVLVRK